MCFNCLVISGEANVPEWQQWADHPVRKEYDFIMDLGEGAFSQVVREAAVDLHGVLCSFFSPV